CARGWDGAYW
nr:immunoglobulin heavy chain junction region [Mus musculus]MBK4197796.1 immunoglobulin heavy chain junction region [Mus musculus]